MIEVALLFFVVAAMIYCTVGAPPTTFKRDKPEGSIGSIKRKHGVRDVPTKPAPINPPKGHRSKYGM